MRRAALATVAVLVVGGVLAGLLAWTGRTVGPPASDVASQHVEQLVGIDADTVGATVKALRATATGAWAKRLADDPDGVSAALGGGGDDVRGRVDSVAVQTASGDRTTVLVAASALSDVSSKKPTSRRYFLVVRLAKVDHRWAVRQLEAVS